MYARKPSLVPDSVKASRHHIVEEALAMGAALTVADALRRSLAHRHRQEALAGRGPAAKALLRRSPPRPPGPQIDSRKFASTAEYTDDSEQQLLDSVLEFEVEKWEDAAAPSFVPSGFVKTGQYSG